jgi:hypothetical protein
MSGERPTHDVRQEAFARSDGMCECTRNICKHHKGVACTATLRGASWEVWRVDSAGPYTLANVQAICLPCYRSRVVVRW